LFDIYHQVNIKILLQQKTYCFTERNIVKNFKISTLLFASFASSSLCIFGNIKIAEARSCDGIWNPIKRLDCERLIIKEQIERNITNPATEKLKKARDAAIEAGDRIDANVTRPILIKPIERLGDFLASSSEQWGEAGRSIMYIAKAKIASDNLIVMADEIHPMFKEALRPKYGSLVDKVRLVYGANILTTICLWQNKGCIDLSNTLAQTFGDTIYIKYPKPFPQFRDSDSQSQGPLRWDSFHLSLIAHELKHSQQYRDAGSTGRFGYEYFKSFKEVNQSYENISKEIEASEFAAEYLKYKCTVEVNPRCEAPRSP
jgi:hypothetical protein